MLTEPGLSIIIEVRLPWISPSCLRQGAGCQRAWRPRFRPPPERICPRACAPQAVIGARKIFQRMTTYAKYTVAMTFRICFTFGLLTVLYNWWAMGAATPPACVFDWRPCLAMHSGLAVRGTSQEG